LSRSRAAVEIPAAARSFLERPGLFATIATINPDGSPNQAVVWYVFTDDAFLVNSREGRQWPSNLRRDPRASIAVEDGYTWVGARGEAEIIDDQEKAQAHIAALARRYRWKDPKVAEREIAAFQKQRRVSFLIRPRAIYLHLDDD
jgi:PPOX class probable F420-dependent enzyme